MKKLILPIAFTISAIATIFCVAMIEKNKKTPVERYLDTSQTSENSYNEPTVELIENDLPNNLNNDTDPAITNNVILNKTHTVQYEFLSYEIINDTEIANQTKYLGEFFYDGTVPDPNFLVEYTDFQAMRKDYPEVDEYISSNGEKGMTEAEYQAFLKKHVKEYSTESHPKTEYIFLRCRITNISKDKIDEYLNDIRIVMMYDNKILGFPAEINCYFDCSSHISGDDRIHNFFLYQFEPEETIECVLGCAISEDPQRVIDFSKKYSFYIGFLPIGLENLYQLDPSKDEGFILLDSLQKEA